MSWSILLSLTFIFLTVVLVSRASKMYCAPSWSNQL